MDERYNSRMPDETELFAAVGGEAPFYDLVDAFYRGVDTDTALRALYPQDLAPGKQHLAWFLIQRFGGPELFNRERGAPRLRMRHIEFAITQEIRDAWVKHMLNAIECTAAFVPYKGILRHYFEQTATFLINREEPIAGRLPLETL